MHVIVKRKDNFVVGDFKGVKNIAYASGTFSLTMADDTVQTYASDTYYVLLLII